jgi:hypothetical protein
MEHLGATKRLGSKWCNITVVFSETVGSTGAEGQNESRRLGMDGMLKVCGLDLKGRHHSGIDDQQGMDDYQDTDKRLNLLVIYGCIDY